MVHLYDVLPEKALLDNITKGYVRHQTHPDGSRAIFNYTNKAQFDNEWNEVTKKTRGLIIDTTTEKVVARPFEKFFNWSQIPADQQARLINEPVKTYVKWDGSLGVGYLLHTGEFRIATRGSFTSPQAQHANKILETRYPTFEPILGLTYLFEIVFPSNRIVVDYKGLDDLVLLAVVDTQTGRSLPWGPYDWPGPVNQPVGFESLSEVLAAPQEENQEGFVVHFPGHDLRVKFKFDEYVRLHRILTNTSTLTLWEALVEGDGIEAIIDSVPDEFYDWVRAKGSALQAAYTDTLVEAREEFDWILRRLVRPEDDAQKRRKEFALLACESPYRDILFGLYGGQDITSRVWKRVKPAYEVPFASVPEAAA
jgi:RNA ligase